MEIKHYSGLVAFLQAPEMSLISTFVDLRQGVLFVESPRCKTELQILLKSVPYGCGREEIDLHGHRFLSVFLFKVLYFFYPSILVIYEIY